MSDLDDMWDRLFDEHEADGETEITCKRCGAQDLHWEEARGERNEKRWVLMEANDTIHCCPRVGADDFDLCPPSSS